MREVEPAYDPEPVAYKPEPVARPIDTTPREPFFSRFKPKFNFNFKIDPTNAIIAGSGLVIVIGLGLLVVMKFRGEKMPTLAAVNTTTRLPPTSASNPPVRT